MSTHKNALRPLWALVVLTGCASPRFAYQRILWHDPDDLPVPAPPKRKNPEINWEGARDTVFRPAQRFFALDYGAEAKNVNALDEVPDSSWFVDRRRDPSAPDDQPRWRPLPPEVVEHGPALDDAPTPPFTVLQEKTIGSAPGLVVQDARGVQYQLKFDPPAYPGLVTSIEVVATRLAWAAGWNVPATLLVNVHPDELRLAPGAWTVDRFGHRVPFTTGALRELLTPASREGTIRAVASRWIEGNVIGWFSYLGRDKRDKNDRVDHQNRRDLRGFGVWAAWVDDVDTFENNTLDTYFGAPGQGHVVHYQQGVGASFGRFAGKPIPYWMGQAPYFSPGRFFGSLLTLGLLPTPWANEQLERAREQSMLEWPEFGFFDAEHFDPRRWTPVADNPAFVRQTKRDRYWGAKQIVAFNEEEIRAAIRAGEYRPAAAEHLFQVLWGRRERIARAFFADVSPLDHFQIPGDQLCFEDLWITAGLGGAAGTTYEAKEILQRTSAPLPVDATTRCLRLPFKRGYRVVALRARRPGGHHDGKSVEVHLVDRDGGRHLVGIVR
jgi:hypothetical protein